MQRKSRPFAVEPSDYDIAPSGCWLWKRNLTGAGYGVVKRGRDGRLGMALAHRLSYEQTMGPIPEGLVLDHLCRTPRCVNPEHLEPVSQGENIRRGEGPAATNARKTHCKRGHELNGDNVRVNKAGSRVCRACEHERLAPRIGTCRFCAARDVRIVNGGWCDPCWRDYQKDYARRKAA